MLLVFAVFSVMISTIALGEGNGYALLIEKSPPAGGVVTPGIGVRQTSPNETVLLDASPKAGYRFVSWLGDVKDPTRSHTSVFIDSPKLIVAVFERISSESSSSSPGYGSSGSRSGGAGGGRRGGGSGGSANAGSGSSPRIAPGLPPGIIPEIPFPPIPPGIIIPPGGGFGGGGGGTGGGGTGGGGTGGGGYGGGGTAPEVPEPASILLVSMSLAILRSQRKTKK